MKAYTGIMEMQKIPLRPSPHTAVVVKDPAATERSHAVPQQEHLVNRCNLNFSSPGFTYRTLGYYRLCPH